MRGSRMLWAGMMGFLGGIVARSIASIGVSCALLPALIAVACLVLARDPRRQGYAIVAAVFLIAVGGGIVRMDVAVLYGDPVLDAHIDEHVTIVGRVFSDVDTREASARVPVEVRSIAIGSTTRAVGARMLAVLPPHAGVAYGDEVRLEGVLGLPEVFDTGAGRQFDYSGYLAASGIGYRLDRAQVVAIGGNDGNPALAAVLGIKYAYLDGLHAVLPEPHAGLAAGITVGDKRSIGPDLTADFQRASLMHVLVLSGYNITIVMAGLSAVLATVSRTAHTGSLVLVAMFFIALSGGASSAMRAGIMAIIAVYARQSGRVYLPLRIVAVAACAMALWNPWVVAFDPGFQLSVMATVGLVAFTPIVAARLRWATERLGLREIIASTIGTQIAVLPLLLHQSGQLSLVALPANILALVPVPWAMAVAVGAGAGGMVLGAIVTPLAAPAYLILGYVIAVAQSFGSLPFAVASIGAFGGAALISSYVLLWVVWMIMRAKREAVAADGQPPALMRE